MRRQQADEDRDTVQEGEHALFQKAESFLNRWTKNHFAKSLEKSLEEMIESTMQPMFDRFHAELSKLKAQVGAVDKATASSVDVNVSLARLGGRSLLSVARRPPEKSIDELLSEVETERQAEELWQRSPAIRDEFQATSTLFAYCRANRAGLIHWQQKVAPEQSETPDEALLAISTRERAMEVWEESPKLRAEFESVESMWACAQAMQSGRARIFRADHASVVK